jgi:hypothetical protein
VATFLPAAGRGEVERFVRGQQPHPSPLETVLDVGADVGAAGDAFDGLADDVVEAAVGAFGFGEQVVDAAVAVDRDREHLVRGAAPAGVEVLAAGLDVVEVRHDHGVVGQHHLAAAQLPRQRQGRVLLVVGGGAARPRDPEQHRLIVGGRCRRRAASVGAGHPARTKFDRPAGTVPGSECSDQFRRSHGAPSLRSIRDLTACA